jgi:DNA-binding transcriptional regulator YdaS (Cro superfamily)
MAARHTPAHEDKPYLEGLFKPWGLDKLEIVTRYSRSTIYQWRPSRSPVPPEAALRVCELAEPLGYFVERLCPTLPWHLVYGGRGRRKTYEGLADTTDLEALVKHIGVTEVSRVSGRSRQGIYDEMRAKRCSVWLALAIEQASEQHYLVEDLRPELPWWPLYNRRQQIGPVKERS